MKKRTDTPKAIDAFIAKKAEFDAMLRGGSVYSDRILRKLSGSVCQFLSCFADHGHQVGRA